MLAKTLIASAALAAVVATPAAAQSKLEFNRWLPDAARPMQAAVLPWVKEVREAVGDKLAIEITGSSLVAVPRQMDAVRNGVVDIAVSANSYTRAQAILPMIAEIPLNSKEGSARAHSIALWRTYEKFFAAKKEFAGVKVLGFFAMSPNHVFEGKREIKSLADLKGLKIRTNPDGVAYVNAMGAVVVSRPAPETFEVISSGVADGTIMPSWGIIDFKVADKQPYGLYIPGGFSRSTFVLAMNQAKWDGLAPDVQKAIMSVSGEHYAEVAGSIMDKYETDATAELIKRGTKITMGSSAMWDEMAARMPDRIKDWIADANKKGVDGKAAYDYYQDQIAAVAKK
jgi:TRAP-type C4-dicarboxylate transport system substrate-binding protein